MGSTHCCHSSHGQHPHSSCSCFANDENVKHIQAIRVSSHKWIWSDNHDTTLTESLTTDYNVPLDIIALIKDHSYAATQDYYTEKAAICHEKQYCNIEQLLKKSLCSHWYISQFSTINSLSIGLMSPKKHNRQLVFDRFCTHVSSYLPALQLSEFDGSNGQTARRTMLMNKCPISINLIDLNLETLKTNSDVDVCMLILDTNDDIKTANEMIQSMTKTNEWKPKAFVLGNIGRRNKCEISQFSANYRITSIDVSLNCEKSVLDLFTLAVKYCWFCMA